MYAHKLWQEVLAPTANTIFILRITYLVHHSQRFQNDHFQNAILLSFFFPSKIWTTCKWITEQRKYQTSNSPSKALQLQTCNIFFMTFQSGLWSWHCCLKDAVWIQIKLKTTHLEDVYFVLFSHLIS